MLVYTIGIAALFVVTSVTRREPKPHHPLAYEIFANVGALLMLGGNLLYAFAYLNPVLRKLWKFAFPLVVASFISGAIVSYLDEGAKHPGLVVWILTLITMVALFFPSFRANFLLGYGDTDRVRTIDKPVVMSEDPIRDLVAEMAKARRTAQVAWIVMILLLTALVVNSYFQYHFEPRSDSWLTVIRLVERGKYTEALPIARHLIEKYPDSPDMWVLLGNIQLSLGQLHQAEGSYTHAYELLPNPVTSTLLNAVRSRIDQTDPTPTPTPMVP